MNTFDVLKRRGVKINFTAIIAAVVLIAVTVILFTCRSDDKSDQQSSKSSTTNSDTGKANPDSNKQKDDNTFDDHSGTSKLFRNYKFVGNSDTMVYHVTDGSCPAADKMNPDNIVKLNSKEDARKKGYSRCDICKP